MSRWRLTLQSPEGTQFSVETSETQFVLGTETAEDVYTVDGPGVMARHAWVWISETGLQVEPIEGETYVNGHAIDERVQAAYPASVRVGVVTLVLESITQCIAELTPESLAVTVPMVRTQPTGPANPIYDIAITLPTKAAKPPIPEENPDLTVPWTRSSAKTSPTQSAPRVGSLSPLPSLKAPLSGEYTLVKEIARGGMGQIHLGDDPQLKRQVAVKISILPHAGEDPRFEKEAEVLAQLAHPNIVPIYNRGLDAHGRPFYSMKLIKGRTLQAVLNAIREGDSTAIQDYPRAALLMIFRKVCDALAFAHSNRILHRDLKPENIMVGEYGEVLVMDWGLAKVLGEQDQGTNVGRAPDNGDYGMTLEGEVMGTPQYMSPEQATGMVADLDVRSDIYSLGGILYAILTLRPPIEGRTLEEVLSKVKSSGISSMQPLPQDRSRAGVGKPAPLLMYVPESLQAVTLKAMALDRDKRYPSVASLASDIDAYQNGFATSAEDAGLARRIQLWVGRNRVVVSAASILLLMAGIFTARLLVEGAKARQAMRRLASSAPVFAARASELARSGEFRQALEAAENAVDLNSESAAHHEVLADALLLLMRLERAQSAYEKALALGAGQQARDGLTLCKNITQILQRDGEMKAKVALYEGLNGLQKHREAMAFSQEFGDYWREKRRDLKSLDDLIQSLEAKLLPVPGTEILMSKTEVTVGEWKKYLKAAGSADWKQPDPDSFIQTDEHPVVQITWADACTFCRKLSEISGNPWRLPTPKEWDAAVGALKYPWGDHFPPEAQDGNYSILETGSADPELVGADGIKGTAPVASFRPNALGFFDLGGNAAEWMQTGWKVPGKPESGYARGSDWRSANNLNSAKVTYPHPSDAQGKLGLGFRVVRVLQK
jgi:serine/threonine protein kinase